MRLALASAFLLVVAAAAPDAGAPGAAPATVGPDAASTAARADGRLGPAPDPRCSVHVLHPVEVEAVLVDAMAPGRWLRAVVHVTSRLDLADVHVDLEPAGDAELSGPRKAVVAEIAAARPYEHGFTVRVPDTAAPQQVRIRVSGLADGARLERGAVLHLLPRGVTDPGVESPALSGTQRVLEQRGAARREP